MEWYRGKFGELYCSMESDAISLDVDFSERKEWQTGISGNWASHSYCHLNFDKCIYIWFSLHIPQGIFQVWKRLHTSQDSSKCREWNLLFKWKGAENQLTRGPLLEKWYWKRAREKMVQPRKEICYALEIKWRVREKEKGGQYVLGSFILREVTAPQMVGILFKWEGKKSVERSLIVVECVYCYISSEIKTKFFL